MSREFIIDTAIELIDKAGVARLTMRRLGTACGVEAMALYRYVSGRDDVLSGVVDRIVDRLYEENLAQRHSQDSWQDYLIRLAHGTRRIALNHPELFPLIATRPPEAPWIRPPLRSLRWLESFLDTLIGHGFSDSGAAAAYRAYTTFLLGDLLLEIAGKGIELGADELHAADLPEELDLADYPNLQRLQPKLTVDTAAQEFEESLENLLDRIELLGPRQRRHR
ncbi:TetR/AcrR family transcriptional regulator [Skermania sp. ID1734]|nr:TetR/AcrR family transcriptional regulator [Skermania sp. ID1734]